MCDWLAASTSAGIGVSLELAGFSRMIVFIGYVSTRLPWVDWLPAVNPGDVADITEHQAVLEHIASTRTQLCMR
jgi:hypothetical protein